jgi:hypothetical protein
MSIKNKLSLACRRAVFKRLFVPMGKVGQLCKNTGEVIFTHKNGGDYKYDLLFIHFLIICNDIL